MVRLNGNGKAGARTRVVLLGGKELAVHCLESTLGMPDVEVVAVIPCAGDDPDQERWYPSLARHARDLRLPVHRPRSVNDAAFHPVLEQLRPDILLSIFYDKILKPRVLALPRVAAVNLHFGLLPFNRGSFPIPWAIIDGNDAGVTLHHMDPGVDTGDIVAQCAVPVAGHETAREVYDRCTAAGRYLFEGYFPLVVEGRAPRRGQPAEGGTYYPPGYAFDRWVDWSQPAGTLSRFARALTFAPYPGARSAFAAREFELRHPVWVADTDVRAPAGTLLGIDPRWATIATGDGALRVRTLCIDGVELSAQEALRRLGCNQGDELELRSWQTTVAA
ncbi:MAG: methionyl-tRNA formyltransferase [Dehalococcoidia bacterium]